MTINANGGDINPKSELTPEQVLQVIKMVDEKVEKSESRVIDAIRDLKSEIGAMNRKVDGLASKVDSLSAKVTETDINVSGRMNFHTLTVVALLVAVIFAAISSS